MNRHMPDDRLTSEEVAAAKARRMTAMGLQLIEDAPVSAESVEMFEMFERERWSHERCRAYIADKYRGASAIAAE